MAKLQRERAEKVALGALFAQLFVAILAFVAARVVAPKDANWGAGVVPVAWFLLIGVGFWLMTWLHLRQLRVAEAEGEEWKRLLAERETRGARGRLFEEDEISAQVDRNRLRILEKYVLPTAGLLLSLFMGLVAWSAWPLAFSVASKETLNVGMCSEAAVLFLVTALGSFLLGMYASGMARYREWRALRAGAGYMMSSALLSVLMVIALVLAPLEAFVGLNIMAWLTPALMAVVAIEIFLNFVLDFYRPRIEGMDYRPCYESRLLGMLTEPGGIFRTLAVTLDYQFGFKVSETWFYRFIERAILPLILFGVVAYYLMTCVVIVGPGQRCIIERFGEPVQCNGTAVLDSGFYWKWPWPISCAYVMDTERIRQIDIGYDVEEEAKAATARGKTGVRKFLWTNQHYEKEHYVMVATKSDRAEVKIVDSSGKAQAVVPVSLIVAVSRIQYYISDYEKYLYSAVDPAKVLENIAYREQQRFFAKITFYQAMGVKRREIAKAISQSMQAAVDELGLGVTLVRVCMGEIHPPIKEELGQTYEGVVAAKQEKQAKIYNGEAYANEVEVSTKFRVMGILAQAHAERVIEREKARGVAKQYALQLKAYLAGPEVYRMSEYLDAFEDFLTNSMARVYFVGAEGVDTEVLTFDVKDKMTWDPSQVQLTDTK